MTEVNHIGLEIVVSGKVGDPPPYKWKLFGISDTKTNAVVPAGEATRRLPCWAGH